MKVLGFLFNLVYPLQFCIAIYYCYYCYYSYYCIKFLNYYIIYLSLFSRNLSLEACTACSPAASGDLIWPGAQPMA